MQGAALVALILQIVQAAAVHGPAFVRIAQSARQMIAALFTGGVITKQVQDAADSFIDGVQALVEARITPPHWQVEPDPVEVIVS